MVNITVDHIPFSTEHNRRPNIRLAPNSITIHSTGNATSTAKGERAWLENPSNERTASWHYCVDENVIIEAIPPNYVAWHAGDGNGQGNMGSISIEMCESGDREKVLARTKELTRYLMDKHNIRKVVRHYDWTKKNCPRILNQDGKWTDWFPFLSDVFNPPKPVERKLSGMKPNWKDWQWKEAAKIYKVAFEKGILSSLDWSTKALNKDMTFDDIEYLNLVINGRKL